MKDKKFVLRKINYEASRLLSDINFRYKNKTFFCKSENINIFIKSFFFNLIFITHYIRNIHFKKKKYLYFEINFFHKNI